MNRFLLLMRTYKNVYSSSAFQFKLFSWFSFNQMDLGIFGTVCVVFEMKCGGFVLKRNEDLLQMF